MNRTHTKREYASAVYSRIIRKLNEANTKITLRKLHMLAYFCNAYIMAKSEPKWTIPFVFENRELISSDIHSRIRLMYNQDFERFANNYNLDELMTDEEIESIDTIVRKMGWLEIGLLSNIVKKDIFKGEATPVGRLIDKDDRLGIIETMATKKYYDDRFWNSILSPGVLEELNKKIKN